MEVMKTMVYGFCESPTRHFWVAVVVAVVVGGGDGGGMIETTCPAVPLRGANFSESLLRIRGKRVARHRGGSEI